MPLRERQEIQELLREERIMLEIDSIKLKMPEVEESLRKLGESL